MSGIADAPAIADYGLQFHHFGLAVSRPDLAVSFLRGLGYRIGETTHDPIQNVYLVLCESERAPAVEVIYSTGTPGPVDRLLSDHSELIYHLCFATFDLSDSLDRIRRGGHRIVCVSTPKPAVLFGGACVSFYQVKGWGLIEVLEAAS